MARITVEDCVKVVPSRFDLVVLAAQRVHQIAAGAPVTVDCAENKAPLVALREIAAKTVAVEDLENAVIRNFQRYVPREDVEEDKDLFEQESYRPHLPIPPMVLNKAEEVFSDPSSSDGSSQKEPS
ncbi:MAG: DNA-directed RNA polymerase subunit omega [Holosporales bacterium]|nr:DNA-directed RNA polymerase subunit omega [Holosporales bacterium]